MPQLKGLAEDFPMLGFGRAAVPRRATFQPSDQIIIQIAGAQIPGHPLLHEIIGINDLTCAKRVKIKNFAMSSSVLIPNLRNHDSCYPALCRDGRIESKRAEGVLIDISCDRACEKSQTRGCLIWAKIWCGL